MHWLVGPIVGGVGVVVLIITVVLGWVVVPNIIDDRIIEEVRLVPGTDTWEKWEEIPVPINLNFYTYSITNPDDVERGSRPIFEEKGPYSYRFILFAFVSSDTISFVLLIVCTEKNGRKST